MKRTWLTLSGAAAAALSSPAYIISESMLIELWQLNLP